MTLINDLDLFRLLMEEEKSLPRCNLSSFPDEVHMLRERERERDESRRGQSPGAERRMEQWKREVGRELSTLRGHITRATSLGNLEERCIRGGAGGRNCRLK